MPALRALVCLVLLVAAGTASAQSAGVSPDGEKGTLHVVQKGDTLWAITATYLGTPWIWPSIWKENEDIANPHLIYPGDLIWITDGEMRKVTPEEAARLMARAQSEGTELPASAAPGAAAPGDPFAELDGQEGRPEHLLRYAGLDAAPFVATDELEALGTVLGTHDEHYWIVQEQRMIVSVGEGEAQVGDAFTVFRPRRRIFHPETHEVVGHFVEIIGRVELTEVHPESSYAVVRWSTAEIEPGDRIMPLIEEPEEIAPVFLAEPLEGIIVAHQPMRMYTGAGDLVMLDRGLDDGVTRGAEFEIYRPGGVRIDPADLRSVQTPDNVIGRAFVLKSTSGTSVALLTRARTEVEPGDRYRTP